MHLINLVHSLAKHSQNIFTLIIIIKCFKIKNKYFYGIVIVNNTTTTTCPWGIFSISIYTRTYTHARTHFSLNIYHILPCLNPFLNSKISTRNVKTVHRFHLSLLICSWNKGTELQPFCLQWMKQWVLRRGSRQRSSNWTSRWLLILPLSPLSYSLHEH